MGFTSPQKSAAPARNDQGEFTLSVWVLFVFFSQDSNPLFFLQTPHNNQDWYYRSKCQYQERSQLLNKILCSYFYVLVYKETEMRVIDTPIGGTVKLDKYVILSTYRYVLVKSNIESGCFLDLI